MDLSVFQLRILITGLKFEAKTGMKMSSKVNSSLIAKSFLGLPLNSRPKKEHLIAALEQVLAEAEMELSKA
jgi:hypothetical protein